MKDNLTDVHILNIDEMLKSNGTIDKDSPTDNVKEPRESYNPTEVERRTRKV